MAGKDSNDFWAEYNAKQKKIMKEQEKQLKDQPKEKRKVAKNWTPGKSKPSKKK